jgi:hypothetical protein
VYSAFVEGFTQVKSSDTVGRRQSLNPPCTRSAQHCETVL